MSSIQNFFLFLMNAYESLTPDKEAKGFEAPFFKRLEKEPFKCSLYAVWAAHDLGKVSYIGSHAWMMSNFNKCLATLEGNLEDFESLLTANQSIIIFDNPRSLYRREGRVGTHVGLYLGKSRNGDYIFAEQYGLKQRARSYGRMKKCGLKAKQILAPPEE